MNSYHIMMTKQDQIKQQNWHFTTCPVTGEIDEYVQCSDKSCKCHSKNLNFGKGKKDVKKEKYLKKVPKNDRDTVRQTSRVVPKCINH